MTVNRLHHYIEGDAFFCTIDRRSLRLKKSEAKMYIS